MTASPFSSVTIVRTDQSISDKISFYNYPETNIWRLSLKNIHEETANLFKNNNYRHFDNMIVTCEPGQRKAKFIGYIYLPKFFLECNMLSNDIVKKPILNEDVKTDELFRSTSTLTTVLSYIEKASATRLRSRGRAFCVFYENGRIRAVNKDNIYWLDESVIDIYTKNALLYMIAMTTLNNSNIRESAHTANTYISVIVRKPDDVFFSSDNEYDVLLVNTNIQRPFFISALKVGVIEKIADAGTSQGKIKYSDPVWVKYFQDFGTYYQRHTGQNYSGKRLLNKASLDVFYNEYQTSIIYNTNDQMIVDALTYDDPNILTVVDKLIQFKLTGHMNFNQYIVNNRIDDYEKFIERNFRSPILLNLFKHRTRPYELNLPSAKHIVLSTFQSICSNSNDEIFGIFKNKKPAKLDLQMFKEQPAMRNRNLRINDIVSIPIVRNGIKRNVDSTVRHITMNKIDLYYRPHDSFPHLIECRLDNNILSVKNIYRNVTLSDEQQEYAHLLLKRVYKGLNIDNDSMDDDESFDPVLVAQKNEEIKNLIKEQESDQKYELIDMPWTENIRIPPSIIDKILYYILYEIVSTIDPDEHERFTTTNTGVLFTANYQLPLTITIDGEYFETTYLTIKQEFPFVAPQEQSKEKVPLNYALTQGARISVEQIYTIFSPIIDELENWKRHPAKLSTILDDFYNKNNALISSTLFDTFRREQIIPRSTGGEIILYTNIEFTQPFLGF